MNDKKPTQGIGSRRDYPSCYSSLTFQVAATC
jgi:hypothetical protein